MNESSVDDLYRKPLSEFTAARTALAKTLSGEAASRVKKLVKPTLVPWAINQVYWKARPTYDRLLKAGVRLRTVQLAVMNGRQADVRAAGDAHRQALADAVKAAVRLATTQGSSPAPDDLARTFEAVSLAATPSEPHGRLTRPLQPAGFEAFAGVKPRVPSPSSPPDRAGPPPTDHEAGKARAEAQAARERERALKEAERLLEEAQAAEATARRIWERAQRGLEEARSAVDRLR